jgi:hypothetical protein
VLWNVIPRDWSDPDGWVDRALALTAAETHALVVLHDLPTGAMAHLDRYLGMAMDRGDVFQQAFPVSCLPIQRGRLIAPIDAYLTEAPAAS